MRLTTSLTTLTAAALCLATLSGCAGNSPRRPASAENKSANTNNFGDTCYDAQSRGAPLPAGCPPTTQNRRTTRTLPGLERDQMTLPTMPNAGLPGGGVLGR